MFTKTFSWDWLKSKKEESINTYNSDEHKQLLDITKKIVRNTIYSNGIGTVIFTDGDVFSKEIEFEKMQLVKECTSKEEVYNLFTPVIIKEETQDDFEKEAQLNFIEYKQEVLDLLGEDFNEKNGLFYYKTISLPINSLILNSLIEVKKENKEDVFQSVLMFWMKSCLIPVKEAREDIYANIKKYDVKLTPTGNFLAFRRICKVKTNTLVIEFVSRQYFKIKSWRKAPKDYEVWQDIDNQELKLFPLHYFEKKATENSYEFIGNLFDLYVDLPNLEENHYTDNHTKSYTIKLGETYKIREKDLDFSYYKSCGGAVNCVQQ